MVTLPHFLAAGETASCSRHGVQATGTAPFAALSPGPIAPPPEPRSACSLPHDRTHGSPGARTALGQPLLVSLASGSLASMSESFHSCHYGALVTCRAELCAESLALFRLVFTTILGSSGAEESEPAQVSSERLSQSHSL